MIVKSEELMGVDLKVLAAAAVAFARRSLNITPIWNEELVIISGGMKFEDIKEVFEQIVKISKGKERKTVSKKEKNSKEMGSAKQDSPAKQAVKSKKPDEIEKIRKEDSKEKKKEDNKGKGLVKVKEP